MKKPIKKQVKKKVKNMGLSKEALRASKGLDPCTVGYTEIPQFKTKPICMANLNVRDSEFNKNAFEETSDPVNHPSHYTHLPNGIECIDVIEHFPANIANAMKYLFRAGHKDCTTQDLAKAAWYVQRQIDLLNGNVKRMK